MSTGSPTVPRPRTPAALLRVWARSAPIGTATLVATVFLLVQVVGYAYGWAGRTGVAIALFYVGLIGLVLPFARLLTAAGLSGRTRLLGSLVYTQLFYLSWMLKSPVLATAFDETLHVQTLLSLVDGDGFFTANTMLPISPHYPGLELVAAGLVWVTGLPLMLCQILTVMLSRTVFVLALFWLGSRIGRSSRVGGLVVLLYSASSQFYFFNAMFSYQTLAISMLVATLALVLQAADAEQRRARFLLTIAQLCLATLALTHHLTNWLTLGALWVLAGLFRAGGEQHRARILLVTAEIGTAAAAAWTTVIAPLLVGYLGPIFDATNQELVSLLTGDSSGSRQLFTDSAGQATPLWEIGVMFAAIALWCLLLVPATLGAMRGTTVNRTSSRYLLVGLSAVFPLLFVIRVFPTAAQVGERAFTFVTLALALLVALWLAPRLERLRDVVVPGVLLLVVGGVLLGGGQDWQKVPGPFLPGAEARSVDATTVAFAQWTARYLPTGSRTAADLTLSRVMPDFGPISPVTVSAGDDNMAQIFVAPRIDDDVIDLLQRNQVDFVIVDTRIIDKTAYSTYYDAGSDFGEGGVKPSRQMLLKFSGLPGVKVVLDGTIKVYDVRALRGEPETFVDRGPVGMPGTWHPGQVAALVLLVGATVILRRRQVVSALRRTDGRHLWLACALVPASLVVGVVAAATGCRPLPGSIVLTVGLGALLWVARRRGRAPEERPWPTTASEASAGGGRLTAALLGGAGLLLAVAVVVAVMASWHGLHAAAVLPAPG
ncbi:hypothetical protein [Nocardioides acrostichi]|uniref:Uncharacterized protein n=1 Tax=Nocardioides acrostichi TaxID=2784339 RepID=A0A930Y7I3_9ACTN|nr:hypothetical protein [Nocardioides acrostichi]MBF4162036.1 hypothetical protein [Nocardioides acrostichi]